MALCKTVASAGDPIWDRKESRANEVFPMQRAI
jgi:hypothetical protein